MTTLCFIDTETTGLDPARHEIWEVACSIRPKTGDERCYVWQLPVDLSRADTIALNIGRFNERRYEHDDGEANGHNGTMAAVVKRENMPAWAAEFARLTWGAHLIGCVPSFDENRLERLLRKHGACPGWHYQPIDVETMAAGYVIGYGRGIAAAALSVTQANALADAGGGRVPDIGQFRGALDRMEEAELPIDSRKISLAIGVDPDDFERHTALGDVRWARAIWDRLHIAGGAA